MQIRKPLIDYPGASRSASHWLLISIFALWVAMVVFPALPVPIGIGVDPSWRYALCLAHQLHLAFGSTIVFTYGPLGFLLWPDPGTITHSEYFVFFFISYGVLLWALLSVFTAASDTLVGVSACLALVAVDVFAFSDSAPATVPFIGFCAAVLGRPRWAKTDFTLASLCCGFLLLAKFNEGLVTFTSLLIIAALKLSSKDRLDKYHIPSATFGLLLPWSLLIGGLLLQGAGWSAVTGYVKGSLSLATGYNEMMGLPGPQWQFILAWVAIVCFFVFIPLLARSRRSMLPGLAVALPLAYLFFKHAMVRQDQDHAATYHFMVAGLSVLPLLCAVSAWDRAILISYCFLNLEIGSATLAQQRPEVMQTAIQRAVLLSTFDSLQAALHPGKFWLQLEARNEAKLKLRMAPESIARAVGTEPIDVLPMDEDFVRANHWNWKPRPVLQSYAAFTPYLDNLNAIFLRNTGAAPLILFSWEAVDGRLPPLDDVLSWRTLIDWYDIDLDRSPLFLLRKRSSPRYTLPKLISKTSTHWGEWISVPELPASSFVVMHTLIRPSLLGRWHAFIRSEGPVFLEAKSTSGQISRFRVTWPDLNSGAVISTLPQSLEEVREYFGVPESGLRPRVACLRFVSDHPAEFKSAIPLLFEQVSITAPSFASNRSTTPPALPLQPIWLPGRPLPNVLFASAQPSSSELDVHTKTDDPQLTFQSPNDLSAFKTVVVRAKFSSADRIDLFFGRQIDGRGIPGFVPVRNRWLDVYINVASNPFWAKEAGNLMRFDPASASGINSDIGIKGVWGSPNALPPELRSGMVFYPSPGL